MISLNSHQPLQKGNMVTTVHVRKLRLRFRVAEHLVQRNMVKKQTGVPLVLPFLCIFPSLLSGTFTFPALIFKVNLSLLFLSQFSTYTSKS
jgi:hypothetical protein